MSKKNILIAEDNKQSAELLKEILLESDYNVDSAENGKIAYQKMLKKEYDALLTDWMMPIMDGIELIRKVREKINPEPIVMVITAINVKEAKAHAIESGADDFITKPYDPEQLLKNLNTLFLREEQVVKSKIEIPKFESKRKIDFKAVCIAISSGGPQTMKKILPSFIENKNAVYFIVQHSPAWALEQMAISWNNQTKMNVVLAKDNMEIIPGNIYLAPGDKHMIVQGGSLKIKLDDGPPENFVKPAADPLFRSVAQLFGKKSIAVILTGMGCDGTIGAKYIKSAKGKVIVQDPNTAVVKYMPTNVIKNIEEIIKVKIEDVPKAINDCIDEK